MTEPEIPEGTPRGVATVIKAIGEGWRWVLTPGTGYVTVRKDVEDPRENEGLKTAPTQVPCRSLGLRLQHEDGRRAVATWRWREDSVTNKKPAGAWEFSGPAYLWRPGSGKLPYPVDAKTFKAKVS